MDFIVDESMKEIGVQQLVVAKVYDVRSDAALSDEFEQELKKIVERASSMDLQMLREQPIIRAYREKVKSIGRSLKKYPPSAESMIRNISRSGLMPRINSIVDIYNMEAVRSYLSIGAHDLDKIEFPIEVTQSKREDIFTPILSTEKRVTPTDYIYRDQQGVMAYLDARDSEFYKIDEQTKDILLIIQGNEATSVDYRLATLERILIFLKQANPNMSYEIEVVD